MADPKKLLEVSTSTLGLCDKIEKAQRGRRFMRFLGQLWDSIRGRKHENPKTKFPFDSPPKRQ